MPSKTFRLGLAEEEREGLKSLAKRGRASARKEMHAPILAAVRRGPRRRGRTDVEVADALDIGVPAPRCGTAR